MNVKAFVKDFIKNSAPVKSHALLIKQLGSTKTDQINETLPSIEKLSNEEKEELNKLGIKHNFVTPFAFRLKAGSLGNKLFRTDTEFTKKMGEIFSYPGAFLCYMMPLPFIPGSVPVSAISSFIIGAHSQFESSSGSLTSTGTMAGYAAGSNLGYALSKAEQGISNAYHTIASKLSHKLS